MAMAESAMILVSAGSSSEIVSLFLRPSAQYGPLLLANPTDTEEI
jgi:hypothetical protein